MTKGTEKTEDIFRVGPIRPPSEAGSLLLQVSRGCPWNRCAFCSLYRQDTFRAFSVESIKKDIDVMARYNEIILTYQKDDGTWDRGGLRGEIARRSPEERNSFYVVLNWLMHGGDTVFLQDGNSLAILPSRIAEVLWYLREKLPQIQRVTSYARGETLSKISLEDFRMLKDAGLDRIHSGFESGSDRVLERINKGLTQDQEIRAGRNIKAAGIAFSVYFMPGIGGKELSEENGRETAKVVAAIDPEFVRIRSAVIKRGTKLWEELEAGTFQLCSENDKLMEIRTLVENTKMCTGTLASDHVINLLQGIHGRLDEDHEEMLEVIDAYFSLPEIEQKMFQMARRRGLVSAIGDMNHLPEAERRKLRKMAASTDEAAWNRQLNDHLMRYI